MTDVMLGAVAVLLSMAACLAGLWLAKDRPVESRGMIGLAATGAHLMLSLAVPALVWIVRKPSAPLAFVISVLFFYWLSLIIMVIVIIRWIRGAQVHPDRPVANSRQSNI